MTLSEMEQAVSAAEGELHRADIVASKMARLLIGRLRNVQGYNVLKALKRELRDFDAVTQTWKDRP